MTDRVCSLSTEMPRFYYISCTSLPVNKSYLETELCLLQSFTLGIRQVSFLIMPKRCSHVVVEAQIAIKKYLNWIMDHAGWKEFQNGLRGRNWFKQLPRCCWQIIVKLVFWYFLDPPARGREECVAGVVWLLPRLLVSRVSSLSRVLSVECEQQQSEEGDSKVLVMSWSGVLLVGAHSCHLAWSCV